MSFAKQLKSAKAAKKPQMVRDWYAQRRLADEREPDWILDGFEEPREETITSLEVEDGTRYSYLGLPRVVHDGCKVGSCSWVFLGRATSKKCYRLTDDLVVCSRMVPLSIGQHQQTCWIAYSLTDQIGGTAMLSNCFGPCMSEQELLSVIEEDLKEVESEK